ncbi:MAG TPA: methyltransferase domain-containing protein [Alphaproteobacteria bacterium]|nr:methyltransferase domain-containing protein [Alphaproteobacteria bacterium]
MKSILQSHPKSEILEKGYINIYSKLNSKEKKQIKFKTLYKKEKGESWDDTQIYLTKKFKELVKPNSEILDAGCGNGNYVIDENRKKIAWAVGLDVKSDYTKKNICLDEIVFGNLGKMPFKSNSFDAVISLWVLEHLENPVAVFKEIHRVLKPGGLFFFATPNSEYLPLKTIHNLKSLNLNHLLNKFLFGRESEDIFPTHYKANTLSNIQKYTNNMFKVEKLFLNEDVSYTSFDNLTYQVSKKIISIPFLSKFTHSHIVGILRKA